MRRASRPACSRSPNARMASVTRTLRPRNLARCQGRMGQSSAACSVEPSHHRRPLQLERHKCAASGRTVTKLSLQSLSLSYNNLTDAFPTASLYACKKLRFLDISDNDLAGRLPTDIDALSPVYSDGAPQPLHQQLRRRSASSGGTAPRAQVSASRY